ncbi:dubious [Schizosaccharomyces pombe]|uniref:Putative uncharacterized protein C1347.14c n=1 Tax=Schizosaccharomyces pombe (strain 972 / ATCC 24843) TaxID=284812 RepID=YGEE_SCHPO|nr:uncharacterized protein SPBC1347.14c [Schizosaccharomyces pombe]Q2HQL6.1 RecName: Full=Putative uncharacterized protein C1347.14c [Schizosaccharomyces pombe 972h-]CAJ76913.1 dubious [Schizosaccharomyces pombe]|eukprot:NP_001343017.1 uncharacterized protein SPBC1347.14c [Schizosaccharomyces pombe]
MLLSNKIKHSIFQFFVFPFYYFLLIITEIGFSSCIQYSGLSAYFPIKCTLSLLSSPIRRVQVISDSLNVKGKRLLLVVTAHSRLRVNADIGGLISNIGCGKRPTILSTVNTGSNTSREGKS